MERDKIIMIAIMAIVVVISFVTIAFNNNRKIHKYAEYADATVQGISGNDASGLIYQIVLNKSESVKIQKSKTIGFEDLKEGSTFKAVLVTDYNGNLVAIVNVKEK